MNIFKLAYQALMSCDIKQKIQLTQRLHQLNQQNKLTFQTDLPIHRIADPGRPSKPKLVRFQSVPKRDQSDRGFIQTIHAICHIEFNAINLALDALYRFRGMPPQFYSDWIQVAFEESEHFQLINNYLVKLGFKYGDFDAHNGLWNMTYETDYDVLARMALVPRVLEARGLDATPKIQKRFKKSKYAQMVKILDIIFKDEIGHVKIGNTWYHQLCDKRGVDPIDTFGQLIEKHIGNNLRGPFNLEARKLAEFTKKEINYLQSL